MLSPKLSLIYNGRPSFANPTYLKKAQSEKPCLYEIPYDKDDLANIFAPDREETLTLEQESRSKLNKDKVKPYDYTKQKSLYEIFKPPAQKDLDQLCELKKLIEKMKGKTVDTKFDKPSAVRQPNALRILKPLVLGVIHRTSVSRPQLRSTQMKEKVMYNNGQVKFKKTEVEDHHRISSSSNKTKSVTVCNDSLKSRTLNVNVVCATCEKCVFNSNHDACVSKFINDVDARTKKPKIWRLSHLNFDTINLLFKKDIVIGLPKLKYVKDQLCSSCQLGKAKRSTFKTRTIPSSKKRLNLLYMDLCGPMRIKSINGKKYILVIIDDCSQYTWTYFLRTKDETPEVLKNFLKMIQCNLQAQVITVHTDRGTKFLNKTLHAYFKEEGIEHQTSTPRTPE
ncbi:retrovirus-related pol polyprotein from transposon TNT 1-94 [Tanacetum coccineum]